MTYTITPLYGKEWTSIMEAPCRTVPYSVAQDKSFYYGVPVAVQEDGTTIAIIEENYVDLH